jgi:hypothetical protein
MLDGSLKLYKLSVCCLHAITAWHTARGITTGTIQALVNSICDHASRNTPPELGQGGGKLWSATFGGGVSRTKSILALILNYATAPPPGNPPAMPPATQPAAGGNPAAVPDPGLQQPGTQGAGGTNQPTGQPGHRRSDSSSSVGSNRSGAGSVAGSVTGGSGGVAQGSSV